MNSYASRTALRCSRYLETAARWRSSDSAFLQRSFVPTSTVTSRKSFHSGRRLKAPSTSTAPSTASKSVDAEAASSATRAPQLDISKDGFADAPSLPEAGTQGADPSQQPVDWTRSYHGLSATPFSAEAAEILQAPLDPEDVEIKPDGILYLPEIKYRRILNKAFGPGGWGLAPRGETIVTGKAVTREYALVVLGRLVSIARGEQDYFSPEGIPTAAEGCRSNALLRCCKDLGIASELWDPRFIRDFMKKNAKDVWVEHVVTKKKKKIVIRKDGVVAYPFKETKA